MYDNKWFKNKISPLNAKDEKQKKNKEKEEEEILKLMMSPSAMHQNNLQSYFIKIIFYSRFWF